MQTFADEFAALKQALKGAEVPVDRVLAKAGVNRSTWTRWGQGQEPQLSKWDAVRRAAAEELGDAPAQAA